jgi:hypothetical protein
MLVYVCLEFYPAKRTCYEKVTFFDEVDFALFLGVLLVMGSYFTYTPCTGKEFHARASFRSLELVTKRLIAKMNKSSCQKKKSSNSTATVPDNAGECSSPAWKKHYNFSKRKAKFTRERDRSCSPSADQVPTRKRDPYHPPSPDAAYIRLLRRTKEPPTCLLFGLLKGELYPDHIFCSICKQYENCISTRPFHGNANRDSRHFRCTTKHTDHFLPTHKKKVLKQYESFYTPPTLTPVERSFDTSEDCKDLDNHDSLMEDFRTLQLAFDDVQKLLAEQESRIAKKKVEFMNLVRSNMQEKLESELTAVSTYIQGLKGTIQDLQQKVNSLQTTVNKYKKSWTQWKIKSPSH